MNLPFALRPRLFALITAIEKDCRDFLIPHLTLEDFPTDIKDKALERLDKKKLAHDLSVITLIEQIDFTHISKLLYKIKNKFTSEQQYYIKHIADQILDPLAGIRNRVCHTSPLEPDDYEKTEHFCRTLGMRGNIHSFSFVEKALSGTYNPAYNPIAKQSRITHNLPSVEYEDTGFRGRTTELEELKRRLCQHSTPIISIVGEGGIGKTAFALNCLYTIVEEDIAKFDFIVWNSFKQDRLTGKGIESINDNLSSVLNTVDSIRAFGEIEKGNATDDEIFEKILEFLRQNRVLMILDNLETLSYDDPYLIKLVSQLPEGSKLLFTTRIGLGQYEQRFDLTALDKKTTEDIFIRYSRYLNISVSKINPKDIEKHCQNLFGNPLLIKWYLQNVKDGVDVSYLSKDGVSYIEAQKFCFKNIYNYYTKEQKTVLNILLVLNRPVALCEIMYYASKAGLHFDDVRRAFNPLNATGIFTVEKDSLKNYSLYSLTPFVKDYINNQCPTKELQDLFRSIQEVQKKLRASRQQDQVNTNNNKFLIERVSIRETDHVGLILRDELNTVFKLTDNKEALEKLNDLKNIFPSFSEIYRISGLIKTKLEDFMGARSDYERAVDLDPEDTLLLYTYAKFLAKEHSEDFQEALYYIDKVIEYEPREEWTLTSTRAEYLKMLGRYEEAKEIFLASIKDHNNNYTYDQVVDCFRRSAEQAANNGKADLFNTELTEAIHYLDKALSSEFYDKQTVVEKRLPKILGEMERHPRILSIETVDILKQLMKKHKGKMNSQLQTSFTNFLMSYNSAMRKDGVTKPFSVNSKYTKTSSTYGKINANTY